MKMYNKLVRDKIPQLMDKEGKNFQIQRLDDGEYLEKLQRKLHEEVREFDEAGEGEQIEELADILEVIYAIVEAKGLSLEQFEQVRLAKREKRGGFAERIFLIKEE